MSDDDRELLLEMYPPKYPDVIAHHITEQFPVDKDDYVLPTATEAQVIGVADNNDGVQALVCMIDETEVREDGGIYHITWSIDKEAGKTPVMSNTVIEEDGWEKVSPVEIKIIPKFFRY